MAQTKGDTRTQTGIERGIEWDRKRLRKRQKEAVKGYKAAQKGIERAIAMDRKCPRNGQIEAQMGQNVTYTIERMTHKEGREAKTRK